MDKVKKEYEYEAMYGGTYQLTPRINMYANNDNLYVGFDYFDNEYECWDPYCDATVNIIPLAYLEAAIDTNNNGMRMLDFLESAGFGKRTPFTVSSGFCTFPIFKFNEDRIREIDPVKFAEYQKAYGMEKKPLDKTISGAASRAAKAGPSQDAKEAER